MPATSHNRSPWRETVAFFVLAYALSWWASLFRPHSIIPLGPLAAALIVLALARGARARDGVADLVRRTLRWRVAPVWYLMVLAGPPALAAVAAGLNRAFGAPVPPADRVPALADAPLTFLGILLFIGLGEEPAWRGFAQPRLERILTPAGGLLALWLLHALWHLPLFGLEYDATNLPPWMLGLLGYTVFCAWLVRRTDGNLLLPSLLHSSLNTAAKYVFGPMDRGPDLIRLWWLWGSLWLGAGAIAALALLRAARREGAAGAAAAAGVELEVSAPRAGH
jgi:membrane protease YdiL (CAAX protease family)